MRPGPAPTLAAVKRRRGTLRPVANSEHAQSSRRSVSVAPPSWLSPAAAEEWQRVAKDLDRQGRLATMDESMLGSYCMEITTYRRLCSFLAEHGHVYVLPNGISALRPESKLADTALKNSIRLAAEFGLTPNARTRANTEAPGEETPDWRDAIDG
jgi:P27 family predicted phage terminase small subunit